MTTPENTHTYTKVSVKKAEAKGTMLGETRLLPGLLGRNGTQVPLPQEKVQKYLRTSFYFTISTVHHRRPSLPHTHGWTLCRETSRELTAARELARYGAM